MSMTDSSTLELVEERGEAAEPMLVFAPLHKRALGTALGGVVGLAIFAITVFHVILQPEPAIRLHLLGQYFYGYDVSWKGAFVGLFWGFVTGFVAGWFTAFCRNLMMATFLFVGRAREELRATRGFLDHI